MGTGTETKVIVRILLVFASLLATLSAGSLAAQQLDELSLARWAKLTETQRYQLQIAEKYFRDKDYKVAAAEYEKYLTLYEDSDASAYAQLKWSICQVQLRQANTAISDGFQSVVDYWPDSTEAVAAQYYVGKTYKSIGRIPQAKKALQSVVNDHPDHLAAVFAMANLIEIATVEKDVKTRMELWRKLTFDIERNKFNSRACQDASRKLAGQLFSQAAFAEGVKALATSYDEGLLLDNESVAISIPVIRELTANETTAAQGNKLTDAAIAYLRQQTPPATDETLKQAALQYGLHAAAVLTAAAHIDQVPKTYEQLHKQFGPNDEILRRLAEWYKSQKMYDQARSAYRRYADKAVGLGQIAYSYRQQGDVASAVETYNQLLALDVEQASKWQGEIAATYRGARKYAEAIQVYESLMASDIENADRWRWQVATAYQDWGKYKQAIGYYRQCTNFPENYKQMAACHRKLKMPQDAIILYNQVMAHESSAPWALLQIGYTREEAGQKEQAIKTFQSVCKRYPKHTYASTAHAHLQNEYKISVTLGGAKDE